MKGRNAVIDNPTVVVEVMSPSSMKRDGQQGGVLSFRSVAHILLVSQDAVLVDHFERQSSDQWILVRHRLPDAIIRLLDAAIGVGEIYDRILV